MKSINYPRYIEYSYLFWINNYFKECSLYLNKKSFLFLVNNTLMQVVYLYNIVIVWLHYSCLTADRLQAPSPLLPLLPYLVRLIRDPRWSFFGTSEKLKLCKPLTMWEFSSQPSPLTTIKAKASCPSLLSQIIFRPAEELVLLFPGNLVCE